MSILWTLLFWSNLIIICSWKLIGTTQCSTCFYYNRHGGWTPPDWEIPDVKTGGISRRIRCIHQNMYIYVYQTHERLFVRLSCSNSNIEQHLPSALFIPQIIKIISKIRKFPPVVFFIFKCRSCQTPWASRHIWLKVSRPRQKGAERRRRKYLKDGNNSFTCLLRDSLTSRRARWCQIRSINEERLMTLIVHCSHPSTLSMDIEKGPKIISHLFFFKLL
jgi:hypothetical protein